jgi:HD-like signal output (HDOD) protein
MLPPDACRFLESLVRAPDSSDLQTLPPDDRLFLSEIMKKLRDNSIEVPVLPNTAIEISRLLADPNSNLADFVKALETDPALSVGILRIANSAFYGLSTPTNSLRDAVFRIGLSQLRTIVILSHMQDKVLQSGLFEREVGWLSDLSMAMAHLGQMLARELGLEPSVAFTRGVLSHLEHFLIMGTLAEVARQHRVESPPSEECLHQAFYRCGPKIRDLAARLWELEELLADDGQEDTITSRYDQLRTALVADWIGATDLPEEVEGVSKLKLVEALTKLSPE